MSGIVVIAMSGKLLSKYHSELNDEAKKRYIEKMKMINGVDPYFKMENKSGRWDAGVGSIE